MAQCLFFKKKINLNPLCIEIFENKYSRIKEKENLNLLKVSQKISDPVDLVFSSNVLEHIKDDYEVLKNQKL